MAKCPFCSSEIDTLYVDFVDVCVVRIEDGLLVVEESGSCGKPLPTDISCPECERCLPLSWDDAEEFLKGKIILAPKRDCAVKEGFAAYGGKVYRVRDERESFLVLAEEDDDVVAAIVRASLI